MREKKKKETMLASSFIYVCMCCGSPDFSCGSIIHIINSTMPHKVPGLTAAHREQTVLTAAYKAPVAQSKNPPPTHTHTHTYTYTGTRSHTHTHTYKSRQALIHICIK